MKIGIYTGKKSLKTDDSFLSMEERLKSGGAEIYYVYDCLESGTDLLLSAGGDGTFLSAASFAVAEGVPVLGVNFGRLGFLSEYRPEEAVKALESGEYIIEEREVLQTVMEGKTEFALNEVSVHRNGSAMLGMDVLLDGVQLPTYWADGLLVATGSGSTAYSLSAGGPICMPDSKVLIITPISPHNLNVRPLVISSSSKLELSIKSRDNDFLMTADNRSAVISKETRIPVSVAQFSLKRVRLDGSSFIKALRSKLYWGEDVRNEIL